MYFSKPSLGTQLDWGNPLNKGLVMHLAMNEGNGDKVQDLSMYGNHGTMHNFAYPPTVASGWNPGKTGVGVNFDGTNDYIDCGNRECLDITDAITISVWIYPNIMHSEYHGIIEKYVLNNKQYILYGSDLNKYTFTVSSDGTAIAATTESDTLIENNWHLLIAVYDSTYIRLYIDGDEVLPAILYNSGIHTSIINNLQITGTYFADTFDGSIDQVRIQSRAWSAKEVLDYSINPWQVYLDEDD